MTNEIPDSANSNEMKVSAKPFVRVLLLVGGFLFVCIGILGMFLPLLPTTIFFILAAWCFARSSEKLYHWLHSNKMFGKYLSNYRLEKGMTVNSKIFTITLLWTGILMSVMFAAELLYVRLILIGIAIGVTWHIAAINTIRKST